MTSSSPTTTAERQSGVARARDYCRRSAVPYLATLIVSYMLAFQFNYLGGVLETDALVFKGQSPGIYVPLLLFPVAAALWLLYAGRPAKGWVLGFLGLLAFAWVVHLTITMAHGDMYTHAIWLYLPTLAMIALKSPGRADAWTAVVVVAWTAATLLVVTRLLEIVGWVPMFKIPDLSATEWEKQNYWLPFSGYLGLNGRWPGPFGFNDKTGFMSAIIVIVAVQRWRWSSLLLGAIGLLGVMLTGGRGPYLAVLTGLGVLLLFSPRVPLVSRIPAWLRLSAVGAGAVALAGYFAFFTTAGVTGRGAIWAGFLDLWQTSPFIGAGQSAIWQADGIVGAAMDAHSLYVQELTEYGIVGAIVQYGAVAVGLALALRSAARGWPGPLAIVVAYLLAGVTNLLHDGWIAHSAYTLLVIAAVLSAAGGTRQQHGQPVSDPSSEHTPSISEAPRSTP